MESPTRWSVNVASPVAGGRTGLRSAHDGGATFSVVGGGATTTGAGGGGGGGATAIVGGGVTTTGGGAALRPDGQKIIINAANSKNEPAPMLNCQIKRWLISGSS